MMSFYEKLPSCTRVYKKADGVLVWCFPAENLITSWLWLNEETDYAMLDEIAACAELAGFGKVHGWLTTMRRDPTACEILPVPPGEDCFDKEPNEMDDLAGF
jgi:hypothetical protein